MNIYMLLIKENYSNKLFKTEDLQNSSVFYHLFSDKINAYQNNTNRYSHQNSRNKILHICSSSCFRNSATCYTKNNKNKTIENIFFFLKNLNLWIKSRISTSSWTQSLSFAVSSPFISSLNVIVPFGYCFIRYTKFFCKLLLRKILLAAFLSNIFTNS